MEGGSLETLNAQGAQLGDDALKVASVTAEAVTSVGEKMTVGVNIWRSSEGKFCVTVSGDVTCRPEDREDAADMLRRFLGAHWRYTQEMFVKAIMEVQQR